MMNRFKKTIFLLAAMTTFTMGCASSADDTDAIRSGATEMQLNQVVQELISPTNGDCVDWKMITLPAPGTIKIELVLVKRDEIFGTEIKIYDRFGIPVKNQSTVNTDTTSQRYITLTALLPEGGLHFVKISAEGGETDYTVTAVDFEISDGYDIIPDEAPSFAEEVEFEQTAAPEPTAKSGKSSKKAAAKSDDDDDDSSSSKKKSSKSGKSSGKSSSDDDAGGSIKPICSDIKSNFEKIDGKIVSVTAKGGGAQIRINVGSNQGVRDGSVGEIYNGGGMIKGARFKCEKITSSASICVTNASVDDLEGASKVVVKSPN